MFFSSSYIFYIVYIRFLDFALFSLQNYSFFSYRQSFRKVFFLIYAVDARYSHSSQKRAAVYAALYCFLCYFCSCIYDM